MADTMQFDLVSPERRLASMAVTEVEIPGAEGDMTAMPGHTPTITTLRPGLVKARGGEGEGEYVVTGGFAEIGMEGITVLAERAIPRGEMTQAHLDEMIAEAKEARDRAKQAYPNEPGPVDDAARLLEDMVAVGSHIGLDPKQASL
ncbi:F0F1 ATP synthase subunit epsilon [Rhodosalinus sp.]|uniref:F0F1 ATP synthase subunit epsilon n=1 Tax=Rhodosalinus sp. TaxID=2047741 RepID=UPI003569FE8D